MLDYLNDCPNLKITVNDEDFKMLMTSELPSAATFIANLFKDPQLYKCALPFSEQRDS